MKRYNLPFYKYKYILYFTCLWIFKLIIVSVSHLQQWPTSKLFELLQNYFTLTLYAHSVIEHLGEWAASCELMLNEWVCFKKKRALFTLGFNTHLIIMISNSLKAKIKLGFLDSQTSDYSTPPSSHFISGSLWA